MKCFRNKQKIVKFSAIHLIHNPQYFAKKKKKTTKAAKEF